MTGGHPDTKGNVVDLDPSAYRHPAMDLLAAGVPLALLLDLGLPGPRSREILEQEGGTADWIRRVA